MPSSVPAPTAAVILIGNELLSGKVTDENGDYLIRELRTLGVLLQELRVVSDEISAIAEAVKSLSERNDMVFTSGGVGPTHDDITLEGIARAFGVEIVENEGMAQHIREVFRDEPERRASFMKMAQVPMGTMLIQNAELFWPIYQVHNVYVLPGVPVIFRRQFDAIKSRFSSAPFVLKTIYLSIGEGQLASTLTTACRIFPGIAFGSYPVWGDPNYRVRVTLEAKDKNAVDDGYQWLCSEVGAEHIFKVVEGAL